VTAEDFDARWRVVTCKTCSRTYRCTPQDDYYNATNAEDGVCEPCLLRPHGLENKVVRTYIVVPKEGGP
jgi:hypothetical protein